MSSSTMCQCPNIGCNRLFKLNKKGTSKCLETHAQKRCPYRSVIHPSSKPVPAARCGPNTLNDRFGTLTGNDAGKQVLLAGGGNVMRLIGAFRKGMVCTMNLSQKETFIGSERYFSVLDSELRRRMERECILEPSKSPVFTSFRKFYSSATPNATVGESGSWYNGWRENGDSINLLKNLEKREKGAWMQGYNHHGKVAWNWPHLLHNRKISGLCVQYKDYTKVLDILDEFLRSLKLSYVRLCDIESILVDSAKSIVDLSRRARTYGTGLAMRVCSVCQQPKMNANSLPSGGDGFSHGEWAKGAGVRRCLACIYVAKKGRPMSIHERFAKASSVNYRYIPARYSGLYDWYNETEKGNLDYYIEMEGGSITRNPDGTGRDSGNTREPIAVWGQQRQMRLHPNERKYFDECNLPFKENGRFIGPHYNPAPVYLPKS